MPVTSSGAAKRPLAVKKKKKGGTPSSRHHHFESFTERIATLSINPAGRARRTEVDAHDNDAGKSHFRRSLDAWRDMNLSEHFSTFVRAVDPLCDSLPQILHHEARIADLLLEHIDAANPLSLEPLLSLASALAHDLGTRFEQYFARTLTSTCNVALATQEVDVLEWSFAALAWLFKYLSRLLVPDLRPTFEIMAPLLGRSQQKPHIARFAAEALAFLIRKAALLGNTNREPLNILFSHVLQEAEQIQEKGELSDTYEYGLMTLFADSIIGVKQGLHSCGTIVLEALLLNVRGPAGIEIAVGTFVNVLHHTTTEPAAEIIRAVRKIAVSANENSDGVRFRLLANLLFYGATLRDGSRVTDWKPIIQSINHLKALARSHNPGIYPEVEQANAAILAKAPLQSVIPEIRSFMGNSQDQDHSSPTVLSLAFILQMNSERFADLFLRQYVFTRYKTQGDEILYLLVKQAVSLPKPHTNGQSADIVLPKPWLQSMINPSPEGRISYTDDQIYRQNACLEAATVTSGDVLLEDLARRLAGFITSGSSSASNKLDTELLLGNGLRMLLRKGYVEKFQDLTRVLDTAQSSSASPLYLDNVTKICGMGKLDSSASSCEDLVQPLTRNLQSPSSDLRKPSIRLLKQISASKIKKDAPILDTALLIEDVPIDFNASRRIARYISQMSDQYKAISQNNIIQPAIIHFYFGMLTHQVTDVWPAAIDALKDVCCSKEGEDLVSSLIFQWLNTSTAIGSHTSLRTKPDNEQETVLVNEFQCQRSERAKRVYNQTQEDLNDPMERLKESFEATHRKEPLSFPDARMQALRILKSISWLAEKKSRQLIPLFLKWITPSVRSSHEGEEPSEDVNTNPRQQRLILLDVLGSFQNPKVLFRSDEIYEALLEVLKSSEVEFQKRALKAILTWKQPSLLEHEELFNMILDDARFRDGMIELSKGLQNESLKPENRKEVMPILLRILFGRMTASSHYSNHSSQKSKRHAVFDALARFDDKDIQAFLQVALGSIAIGNLDGFEPDEGAAMLLDMPVRQKLGVLNVVKEMVRFYGDRLLFLVGPLANITLICAEQAGVDHAPDQGNSAKPIQSSVLGAIRNTALKSIISMFERLMSPALSQLVPKIYAVFITPRINRLAEETAQSVSTLLRLFSAWASDRQKHVFLTYSDRLLVRVADILNVPAVKEEVQLFVIENILFPLLSTQMQQDGSEVNAMDIALGVYLEHTLQSCFQLLESDPSKQVLASSIELVTCIASQVSGSAQATSLLKICCRLLEQPPSRVSPKTKGDILDTIKQLVLKTDLSEEEELLEQVFRIISSLFGYFKDRDNRLKLCEILQALSENDFEIAAAATYCANLNSFSTTVVDEPDFDRRREAYESLIGMDQHELSAKQWRPVLYTLLFYIKETDELGIGSNACFALCTFTKQARLDSTLLDLVKRIVLPAVQKGTHERSEAVRREYLKLMATIVQEHPNVEDVSDLAGLLMDDDEEANVFNNLLHIQQHRRIRALHRLASPIICCQLQSANVAYFLIPMIEHFVFDREDEAKAGDLAAETITTIGALASALEWRQARGLFMKYVRFIGTKPELERATMKLLRALIDAIIQATPAQKIADGKPNGDEHDMTDDHDEKDTSSKWSTLSKTIDRSKLIQDISENLLPPLTAFLHHKDEAVVSIRVPVAVSAAKLLTILPHERIAARLPPMLTDLSHILRSRTPESRDLCRKTLAEITKIIGSSYFGFILRELRGALQRGYQLHVLSYTMHTLLVEAGPLFAVGSLDHCMHDAVAVIMDDIFGAVGMEKEAEEYFSRMKEVKQNKSFDSMELLAKTVSLDRLSVLIRPIQALLQERLDLKVTKKVDELLRRLSSGLLKNPTAEDRRVLVFCYELIQKAYSADKGSTKRDKDAATRRFIVNLRGAKANANATETGSHFGFKIVRFAFDLLRLVLQRFDSLKTSANIAGFMPPIGDAILQGEDEVQMSAMRVLASIMKVPLKTLDTDGPVYISAAVEVIKNTVSNDTDMAQAALKLIASALRERPDIEVKERDVAYLLKRLRPDLDRSENQGFVFNLLKSVVGRGIVILEVYEFMDVVAAMMITSQARETRNMAQAAYFQFLLNYPQGSKRLTKQLSFLRKNLDYPHVEGRKSVLEAIHRLISKVDGDFQQNVIGSFFEPLVLTLINDDNADCRKMAGLLLGACLERADVEQSARIADQTKRWLVQDDVPLLVRAAFQLYAIGIEKDSSKIENLLPILCTRVRDAVETSAEQSSHEDWELLYSALQLLSKLAEQFPESMLNGRQAKLWKKVQCCASYPHTWIKYISAGLLGDYLAHFANTDNHSSFPLEGTHGLILEMDDVYALTKRSLKTLQTPGVTAELTERATRNLAFLAKLSRSQPIERFMSSSPLDAGNALDDSSSETEEPTRPVLEVIFHHLSWLIRSGPASSKAVSLIPMTAALQLCRALCADTAAESLQPMLPTILLPLHQLSDPTVPVPFSIDPAFKTQWDSNRALAHEVVDTLQKRVGSAAYVAAMGNVQKSVRDRREGRRAKRRIESVAQPEKALRAKAKKHERTKERRRERTGMWRERRRGTTV